MSSDGCLGDEQLLRDPPRGQTLAEAVEDMADTFATVHLLKKLQEMVSAQLATKNDLSPDKQATEPEGLLEKLTKLGMN